MSEKDYHVLAYYYFTHIEDPHVEISRHFEFLRDKDIKCRVYISHEGINGQMSASPQDSALYMQWLKGDERFQEVVFKVHHHPEHVFPRTTVKYRKQIVALDEPVDVSLTGEHVSPKRWKEMLENRDENTIVLDVRNAYEWEIGHFEGAELPTLDKFRQFPEYARELKENRDPKETKVMMYCTGGIRCELYSALMKKIGFEHVYQLDGGVVNYGLEEGKEHWQGKLFVFDDRLAVPISSVPIAEEEKEEVISHCRHCGVLSDIYYNCANMDCNELFLACPTCADTLRGCCCSHCQEAPRLRPYEKRDRPKPFRRRHTYALSIPTSAG